MLHLSLEASSMMQSLLQGELILINFLPPKRLFLEPLIYQRIINHWLKLAPKLGFSLFIQFILKYLCPLWNRNHPYLTLIGNVGFKWSLKSHVWPFYTIWNTLQTSIKWSYLDRGMKYTAFEVYVVLTYLDRGISYVWNAGYHKICFLALYLLTSWENLCDYRDKGRYCYQAF